MNATLRKKNTPSKAKSKSKNSRTKSSKPNIRKSSSIDHDANDLSDERAIEVTMSLFSGPLPPPQILEQYEECLPGAADRIMSRAEKEQSHRHWREKCAHWHETLKIWSAFTIAASAIAGACYCAFQGMTEIGIALALSGLAPTLFRRFWPQKS
ncbi:MAG: DUF2335 domain-containing protein [Candidatus Puniceispirillales bacterium]